MIRMNVTKILRGASGEFTLTMQLDIDISSFVAFFGASGAGKTTALRMLAGLTTPDSGEITVNGVTWFNAFKKINLPAKDRNIGFVFQDYALFPTMTVRKNIEYAAGKNREAVENIIDVMGLRHLEKNHPDKLSGGQRQRVALARALVRKPDILLLDEPLSALDHEMRSTLQDEICDIHRRFNLTSVIVTHDITEIYKMSNAVAVFEGGHIVKTGTPESVFGNNLSSKFRVVGKVVALQSSEVATIITVQAGGNQTKVVIDTGESHLYSIGQSVVLAAKAFVPVVFPLS